MQILWFYGFLSMFEKSEDSAEQVDSKIMPDSTAKNAAAAWRNTG